MRWGEDFSSKQPRKNRPAQRGDILARKEKTRRASPFRRVVVGSLVACLIVMVMIGGRSVVRWVNDWTEIQQLTVLGLDHLSREEIIMKLDLPQPSSLWSIDPALLTEQLEAHPWIRSVTFDRVFPHSLVVQVEERRPAAVLEALGKGYFLDVDGYVLPVEIAEASRGLPVLEGMTVKFLTQHEDEGHRRAKQGIHLAALLSERFSGRPRVNVAHAHTTIIDLPRIRIQFGLEAERQWERFLVLYPTVKDMLERQSQEVDLRFSQKVILRKRTL
jgi:cell division protein FtsQ